MGRCDLLRAVSNGPRTVRLVCSTSHPSPALTASVAHAGVRADVWHLEGTRHPDQDRWLVTSLGPTLRIAAIDGVTPWRAPALPGGDAAQAAAATVAGCLLLPLPPQDALRQANRMLHDPTVSPSRRQAMAAVAVADCRPHPTGLVAEVWVAADAEVWAVADDGALTLVAGGEFRHPAACAVWEEQRRQLPAGSDRHIAESAIFDDPASQVCHAVGRYTEPVWKHAEVTAAGLVLASDGARLAEWAHDGAPTVDELPGWLAQVAAAADRDDTTCVVVHPTPQPGAAG